MELGSGAPLSDAPGALGGAPDVLLQSRGPQRLWRFSMHLTFVRFIYNQFTFQTQSENQLLFRSPLTLSHWVVALIENANCNQISWIKMSGLKMGDMNDNSHGSAWEMKSLVEIMGMWVWSVYELLMVCFGRRFGGSPLPSYTGSSYLEFILLRNASLEKRSNYLTLLYLQQAFF